MEENKLFLCEFNHFIGRQEVENAGGKHDRGQKDSK